MNPHHKSRDHHQVKHFDVTKVNSVDSLVQQWKNSGVFAAGHLAKAIDILDEAHSTGSSIFMGLAGAMIPAGMRKVVSDAIDDGYIQALTTTGANVTHDIMEAVGGSHVHSVKYQDDNELYDRGIDRVYDSFVTEGSFGKFEDFMRSSLEDLMSENGGKQTIISQSEFIRYLGARLDDNGSIVKTAFDNDIPIFVPAISDSVLGIRTWLFTQFNPLVIDSTKDLGKIQDLYHEAESNCALLFGGGVPKNYTLQSALMASRHYKYAVQVTLDRVETGGLSGADLEEAKSWGKLEPDAKTVTVNSDITIALPIIFSALRERHRGKHE